MPSKEEEEMRGADVTVVRTESHLARFNNARALFEKLGEENRGFRIEKSPSAAASFAGTRGIPPSAPTRSRSSSAGSVSPPRRIVTPTPASTPAVNGDRLANGVSQPPPKPIKPSVLPKPEKPDRRFNKELIEKQRNWTAHFNKSRQIRTESEIKFMDSGKFSSGYQDSKPSEAVERCDVPSRVYSPPLSPCAGDTQLERPTTLPSSLVTRGITGNKSSSPVKIYEAVSPQIRPNNSALPNSKSDNLISPMVRRDNLGSPNKSSKYEPSHQTGSVEKLYHRTRSSVSPQSETEFSSSKNPGLLHSPNSVLKPIVRISPTPPSPAASASDPVFILRSQKSPSPSNRSLKSPIFLSEDNNLIPSDREISLSPLPSERTQTPVTENNPDNIALDTTSERTSRSQESPSAQFNEENEECNASVTKSPEPCECVSISPKPSADSVDDVVYESVQYSAKWEDQVKRRSSTPEYAPATTKPEEEVLRSPLASPLASPVHRNLSSSPPSSLHPSPSPGKYYCSKLIKYICFVCTPS